MLTLTEVVSNAVVSAYWAGKNGIALNHDDTFTKALSRMVILDNCDADHTHKCLRCSKAYTPLLTAKTEDCPACGFDGKEK